MYKFVFIFSSIALIAAEEFCYRDSEGCGPGTDAWPPICHDGQRQSPVNLPMQYYHLGNIQLKLNVYKGSSFKLSNSGHSVKVTFPGQDAHNINLTFPDPLQVSSFTRSQGQRQYRFDHAHFHWGTTDKVGSEHTLSGRSSAMELHFVHYLANYSDIGAAIASGHESALSVLGLLIDVSSSRSSSVLAPIANNLMSVQNFGDSTTVEESLDFTKILGEGGSYLHTYKGSLTTPDCNEQVNWFVFANTAKVSKTETELFRSELMDGRGQSLNENYRPVQKLNGRRISYVKVSSSRVNLNRAG